MAAPKIAGIIGLGSMGKGSANSLLRSGFEVHAYDVRKEAVDNFANQGGVGCSSPAEVGKNASAVIVLVLNAEQLESAIFGKDGLTSTLKAGSVIVASSTVPPLYAEDLGKRLGEIGILHLDAPVSGGAAKADLGKLTIMASGSKEAFAAADNLLKAVSETVYHIGSESGQGSQIKLINQLLAGVHIAAAAEAMALAIRVGADPQTAFEVISNSAGSSWMFQNRVPHILAGDYTPLSAVNIFVKDLGIVLESAKSVGFPTPLTAAAHQLFTMASSAGFGGEDDSAVIKVFEKLTGIELPQKRS